LKGHSLSCAVLNGVRGWPERLRESGFRRHSDAVPSAAKAATRVSLYGTPESVPLQKRKRLLSAYPRIPMRLPTRLSVSSA
jgi:hypothetical protein